MHELSIVMSIVDMVEEETRRLAGRRVAAVHLRIGQLSGVEAESLLSCFEMATEGTRLDGSRLVMEQAPVLVDCPSCGGPRPIKSLQDFRCLECATPAGTVVDGRDVLVTGLELFA